MKAQERKMYEEILLLIAKYHATDVRALIIAFIVLDNSVDNVIRVLKRVESTGECFQHVLCDISREISQNTHE